jgi:hypothetical protein
MRLYGDMWGLGDAGCGDSVGILFGVEFGSK